ncbi:hypothetical protein [Terrihabitans sp. B22-R8]|uniref:hypothetical protein n=1 Tax=Terrihabitans sp. B22-R8 TaxID=3425128 RepID=UPI00403C1890
MAKFFSAAIAAALAASLFLPASIEAAPSAQVCAFSGTFAPAALDVVERGSHDELVALLISSPEMARDVVALSRNAGPQHIELLASALAGAQLALNSEGRAADAEIVSAAGQCGDDAFRIAQARGFRVLLARGTAPDYVVPLFYDNFGGGLASPN